MSNRRNYTDEIDDWIAEYVTSHESDYTLGGNQYWMEASENMAKAKELDKFDRLRTWQSLKDHFRRVVLPRMKNEDDNSDNAGSTKAKKKKPKAGRLSLTSAYELGAPVSKGSPAKVKQATPDTPRRRSKRTPQKRKVEPEVEMEDDEQDNDLEAESDADSMVGNMREESKEFGTIAATASHEDNDDDEAPIPADILEDAHQAIFSDDEEGDAKPLQDLISSNGKDTATPDNIPTQAQVHQELFQMLLVTVLAVLAFLMFNNGERIRAFDSTSK